MTDSDRMSRKYHERREAGVCVACGGPLDDSCVKCSACRKKFRACPSVANRTDRARHKEALTCIDGCGNTAVDTTRCTECNAIHALKAKVRYRERQAAGLCTTGCGRKAKIAECGICQRRHKRSRD
jgi:hypothetical protein